MKPIIAIISVALAVLLSTVADVYLKKSHLTNFRYLIIGIILYAVAALPIALAFKIVDFSLVFFLWEAFAILLGVILGIIIFKENFSIFKTLACTTALISLLFSYLAAVIK